MKATSLLALVAVSAALLTGCQTAHRKANAWEYKVVERSLYPGQLEPQLNQLANDGWSFVTLSTAFQGENTTPKGFIVVRRLKTQ